MPEQIRQKKPDLIYLTPEQISILTSPRLFPEYYLYDRLISLMDTFN